MIRLAEALTALSLATDAGNGFPLEKSLRNAVIAGRFSESLGLRGRRPPTRTTRLRGARGSRPPPAGAANFLAGGDQVAVVVSIDLTVRTTGVRFQDEDIHLWTFCPDGRVTGYRHVSDTAKHIAAAQQPVAA